MGSVKSFEELEIWKEARVLVNDVYEFTIDLNDYGFKDQIRRAVISVMNNIAEGFERSSNKDFVRFLFFSKASCGEVRSMLYIGMDLNFINVPNGEILLLKSRNLSA